MPPKQLKLRIEYAQTQTRAERGRNWSAPADSDSNDEMRGEKVPSRQNKYLIIFVFSSHLPVRHLAADFYRRFSLAFPLSLELGFQSRGRFVGVSQLRRGGQLKIECVNGTGWEQRHAAQFVPLLSE